MSTACEQLDEVGPLVMRLIRNLPINNICCEIIACTIRGYLYRVLDMLDGLYQPHGKIWFDEEHSTIHIHINYKYIHSGRMTIFNASTTSIMIISTACDSMLDGNVSIQVADRTVCCTGGQSSDEYIDTLISKMIDNTTFAEAAIGHQLLCTAYTNYSYLNHQS